MQGRGAPRLRIVDGPLTGQVVSVGHAPLRVGRDPAADVQLADRRVSRRHASLQVLEDGRLVVWDEGSTGGTFLNGARLHGVRRVRPGDRIRFASVEAVVEAPATSDTGGTGEAQPVRFDVERQEAGLISNVGRDQHHTSIAYHGDDDPFFEVFGGVGPGRVVTGLGLVTFLAGFAIWIYVIFSGIVGDFDWDSPLGPPVILDIPLGAVGFGLAAVGGALSAIGSGMSKAARRRHEQVRERARRRV